MNNNSFFRSFKYSFKSDSSQIDKLTEKNIFYLIENELLKLGGIESTIDKSDYVFTVQFGMDTKQTSGSSTVYVYDFRTKKSVPQQKSYTNTFFSRNVLVNLYEGNNLNVPIWTANCISEGGTNNIYYPAQFMIPFAISVMPTQGSWSRTEKIKKVK